jgi:hypothetical protein
VSDRNSVLRGTIVDLIVTFVNSQNTPTDPVDLCLSIYPPGKDPRTEGTPGDAWVYQADLSNGGSGPQSSPTNVVVKLSEGKYRYSLSVPSDADFGSGFDNWKGELDGEDLDKVFNFTIVGGGSVGTTLLNINNRVTTFFTDGIKALDGSSLDDNILEYQRYFTTTYDPLYASVTQLRMHLGPIAKDLTDDAINLAIFEASLSADANTFLASIENAGYFQQARKGYTICKAQLILLLALSGDNSLTGGFKKTLGDLSVSRFGNDDFIKNRLNNLEECVAGWESVLQSGGELGQFGSAKSQIAVKGSLSSDFSTVGREWSPMFAGERPMANTKTARHDMTSSRRKYRTYVPRRNRGKW